MNTWNAKDWDTFNKSLQASLPVLINHFKDLTAKDVIGAHAARIAIGATECAKQWHTKGHFGSHEGNVSKLPKNFRPDGPFPS